MISTGMNVGNRRAVRDVVTRRLIKCLLWDISQLHSSKGRSKSIHLSRHTLEGFGSLVVVNGHDQQVEAVDDVS